jgi:hypothetical protein
MTKKPFILTGIGLALLTGWSVISSFISQIHWGSVAGCMAGYSLVDMLFN